jgi:hypothetical protein
MDMNLKRDAARELEQLTEHPDIDLHLRIQDHRIEGIAWCQGRRYRLLGVRDDVAAEDSTNGQSAGSGQYTRAKNPVLGRTGGPRWAIWRQILIAVRGTNATSAESETAGNRLKRWSRTG